MQCKVPVILAYLFSAYFMASVYYLFVTSCSDVGTPFKDSLNENQLKIKKEASRVRSNIFSMGVILSVIILAATQPYSHCE